MISISYEQRTAVLSFEFGTLSNAQSHASYIAHLPTNKNELILQLVTPQFLFPDSFYNVSDDTLKVIFAAIPQHIKSLTISNWRRRPLDGKALANALSVISAPIEYLDLSEANLSNVPVDDFIKGISALSGTLTNLNLSHNNLGVMPANLLKRLFAGLAVDTINLANNQFYKMKDKGLSEIFSELSPTVKKLWLTNNGLGSVPTQVLIKTMESFPQTLTSLCLSTNDLDKIVIDDLELILRAVRPSINSLYLANNAFGISNPHVDDYLERMTAAISTTVTYLDLSGNSLSQKGGIALGKALAALSSNLVTLKLCANNLGLIKTNRLVTAFSVMTPSITHLYLESNKFGEKKINLARVFASLSHNLVFISLAMNSLDQINGAALKIAFAALPHARLKTLNLSFNKLFKFKKPKELGGIFAALRATLEELDLHFNSLAYMPSNALKYALSSLPQTNKLVLSENYLGKCNSESLVEIFSGIKPEVKTLDLRWNKFSFGDRASIKFHLLNNLAPSLVSNQEVQFVCFPIANAFRALPQGINQIIMCEDDRSPDLDLSYKPVVVELLNSMPVSLYQIDYHSDQMMQVINAARLAVFPLVLQTIHVPGLAAIVMSYFDNQFGQYINFGKEIAEESKSHSIQTNSNASYSAFLSWTGIFKANNKKAKRSASEAAMINLEDKDYKKLCLR